MQVAVDVEALVPERVVPSFFRHELHVRTRETCGFQDITDEVERFIAACGIDTGMVVLLSLHTTASLLLNERESGFCDDFHVAADELVPPNRRYRHDDMSVRFENLCPEDREFPNGHAHLQHALFGVPSLVVPVDRSRVVLGKWQRVLLVEYDRPRDRRVWMHGFGFPPPDGGPIDRETATTSIDTAA
jgi:secondary thiamine-phosphate synthase enzyme